MLILLLEVRAIVQRLDDITGATPLGLLLYAQSRAWLLAQLLVGFLQFLVLGFQRVNLLLLLVNNLLQVISRLFLSGGIALNGVNHLINNLVGDG